MSAQQRNKHTGRAKRIVVAAVALVALVAVGIALASTAANTEDPDYSGLAVETEPTRPQAPEPKEEEPAEEAAPVPQDPAEEPARPVASPSQNGALHVEGSQLVDAAGDPVQLRGVSTHGLAWYPQYVNEELFSELREDWGANAVRFALYSDEEGGYATDGRRVELNDLVLKGVEYATAADMYAIVDWHILSDGNPRTHAWAAKEFFSSCRPAWPITTM